MHCVTHAAIHARVLHLGTSWIMVYLSVWYGLILGRRRVMFLLRQIIFFHIRNQTIFPFVLLLQFSWHGANLSCLVDMGTYASVSWLKHVGSAKSYTCCSLWCAILLWPTFVQSCRCGLKGPCYGARVELVNSVEFLLGITLFSLWSWLF